MSRKNTGDSDAAGVGGPDQEGVDLDQYQLLTTALAQHGSPQHEYQQYAGNVPYMQMPWSMGGPCDVMPWQELYMDPMNAGGMYDPSQQMAQMYPQMVYNPATGFYQPMGGYPAQPQPKQGRRSAADRRDRQRDVKNEDRKASGGAGAASGPAQPVAFGPADTTVMFRNIPNKYTRDMLVKQLEEEGLKGKFDFVYMPIDFKHQCNVGYAFINFRTVESCATFLGCVGNFEVSKCMPGINSKKVAEVTPARVQGLEENVQRLRNSPVMLELSSHGEWMPLLFDENGDILPFPAPERTLAPIKPRRKS